MVYSFKVVASTNSQPNNTYIRFSQVHSCRCEHVYSDSTSLFGGSTKIRPGLVLILPACYVAHVSPPITPTSPFSSHVLHITLAFSCNPCFLASFPPSLPPSSPPSLLSAPQEWRFVQPKSHSDRPELGRTTQWMGVMQVRCM
jgi:hypothetical protein